MHCQQGILESLKVSMKVPDLIIGILLEEDNPPSVRSLVEASIHLSTRGKTFIASYRGANGEQIWKTTGLRNREEALKLARAWEEEEKRKRASQGDLPKKGTIQTKQNRAGALGFSEAEVAAILMVSERTVRADIRRAFAKLRRHPALREFWREWIGGEIEEAGSPDWELSQNEITAVLSSAKTPLEVRALRKLIALTGTA